jgi:hypothetical protein
MFAKVCFGFSPLDVSLIEKGLALQFILGTNMPYFSFHVSSKYELQCKAFLNQAYIQWAETKTHLGKYMYSSVKKYTRNMSSTSPVICSHFCYPTMFAKVWAYIQWAETKTHLGKHRWITKMAADYGTC